MQGDLLGRIVSGNLKFLAIMYPCVLLVILYVTHAELTYYSVLTEYLDRVWNDLGN